MLICLTSFLHAEATAQFGDPLEGSDLPRNSTLWKIGLSVAAVGGPCKGIYATMPVPTDWPGQVVRVVDEDISGQVDRIKYRVLDNGVKQLLISIPQLESGTKAHAYVTFEVERQQLAPPAGVEDFVKPKRVPREIKRALGASPFIESRSRQIRSLAKQLRDPELSDWEQVELFYDYVRDNVEYQNGELKGALAALQDGTGDCEELTSLFIALCRAHGVPARTVWVPDHCYPEFYLEDQEGVGYWIPCQAAGTRSFGTIPELRPILQKGDNFKVPEKRDPQRYVSEFLTGDAIKGGGRPRVKFKREELRAR
ncbi:MAG: transglutaminase-like domain-containing protein [Planctomycetota bacterium]